MSSDTILIAETQGLTLPSAERYSLDNLMTQKWLDGQSTGAEAAAEFLWERAMGAFRSGLDSEAHLLRTMSDLIRSQIVPKLERKAKEHEKEYPWRLLPCGMHYKPSDGSPCSICLQNPLPED